MSTVIASRYAKALLALGLESEALGEFVAQIGSASAAYEANEELREVLANPLVAYPAKKAIVSDLADRLGLGPMARNTLHLLLDRRRLRLLPPIAQRLRELADARKGVVHAEVLTAAALPESYFERLKAQLEKMMGKTVVLDKRLDPSLIGGVITRIGDTVYDGSLRSQLQSLRNALMPN